jgi:hypothetical protein
MAARFTAEDLRVLADALDQMTAMTQATGVILWGYGDGHVTLQDHVMRLSWQDDERPEQWDGKRPGRYAVEIPDET